MTPIVNSYATCTLVWMPLVKQHKEQRLQQHLRTNSDQLKLPLILYEMKCEMSLKKIAAFQVGQTEKHSSQVESTL